MRDVVREALRRISSSESSRGSTTAIIWLRSESSGVRRLLSIWTCRHLWNSSTFRFAVSLTPSSHVKFAKAFSKELYQERSRTSCEAVSPKRLSIPSMGNRLANFCRMSDSPRCLNPSMSPRTCPNTDASSLFLIPTLKTVSLHQNVNTPTPNWFANIVR